MGLDMYLDKARRVQGITPRQINIIDSYLDWQRVKNEEDDPYTGTMEEWCGVKEKDVLMDYVPVYEKELHSRWEFMPERKTVWHEIGYWRKANAIHNWFVENVQEGNDDCGRYEVSKEQLQELLDTCKEVRKSCKLTSGQVTNGYSINNNGEMVPELEDGFVVVDTEVAEDLLPTTSGFFFGNTEYNEWYVQDIDKTIDILDKVLAETDFDKELVTYSSSW